MRISTPAPSAPRSGLSNLATRVIVTTVALVIVPVTAVSQQDNPLRRWEYFYQQRAYPFNRIPAGALQAARQQEVARWPAQLRGAPAMAFATWTPIGPERINANIQSTGRLTAIVVFHTPPCAPPM